MMGIFQGNSSAAQIWSIIGSVVFSALWDQGFGIHFPISFTTQKSELLGFSYIDNWKMIHTFDDVEDTHSQMQLEI